MRRKSHPNRKLLVRRRRGAQRDLFQPIAFGCRDVGEERRAEGEIEIEIWRSRKKVCGELMANTNEFAGRPH